MYPVERFIQVYLPFTLQQQTHGVQCIIRVLLYIIIVTYVYVLHTYRVFF